MPWSDYEDSPRYDPTDPVYFAALCKKTVARLAEGESESQVREWLESLNLTPYEYEPIVEASLRDLGPYFQRGYSLNWYAFVGFLVAAIGTVAGATLVCSTSTQVTSDTRVFLAVGGGVAAITFGALSVYFFVCARWYYLGHKRRRQ